MASATPGLPRLRGALAMVRPKPLQPPEGPGTRCWRHANSLLTGRQQLLDFRYEHAEVQPPRSPASGARRSSTLPTRCSPSAPTTMSRSRTSPARPVSPAGSSTTTSAVARTSTSGCSSGSAPSASRNSGRPSVAAPVRAWPIQCRAGLTGPRPTERSGSPRSRPVRTSPTPTSGKWSPTSYAEPSLGSRSFTPTSPRTHHGCATRSSAGPD